MQELYNIVLTKGGEYIQNPEHRMQIIKITFVVIMKLASMIRKRMSGKSAEESSDHIECNCNSCKVWRAKVEHAFHHSYQEGKKEPFTHKAEKKMKLFSSLFPKFFKKISLSEE